MHADALQCRSAENALRNRAGEIRRNLDSDAGSIDELIRIDVKRFPLMGGLNTACDMMKSRRDDDRRDAALNQALNYRGHMSIDLDLIEKCMDRVQVRTHPQARILAAELVVVDLPVEPFVEVTARRVPHAKRLMNVAPGIWGRRESPVQIENRGGNHRAFCTRLRNSLRVF